MGEFAFDCLDGRAEPYAAAPTLSFRLRVAETSGLAVRSIALRCQIRVQPQRREYPTAEHEQLRDLFGEPARHGRTAGPFQLATVAMMVPGFRGGREVDLPVPFGYDLEVAAGQYFRAFGDGEIPLLLLFSGTVFADDGDGGLAIEQLPWGWETSYRLPVQVWRDLVDMYFPSSGWLLLSRGTVDALGRFKSRHALPTWDDTLSALLSAEGGQAENHGRAGGD